MADPRIRRADEADIEQCVALALLAATQRSAEAWRGALRRDAERPDHRLVVAERNGAIVGYGRACLFEPGMDAAADTAPRGYYLTGLLVLPEERRRGIATALTHARLEWIRERAEDAWFFANARNAASIELHRRLGFEEVSRSFSFPDLTFEGGEGILFHARL